MGTLIAFRLGRVAVRPIGALAVARRFLRRRPHPARQRSADTPSAVAESRCAVFAAARTDRVRREFWILAVAAVLHDVTLKIEVAKPLPSLGRTAAASPARQARAVPTIRGPARCASTATICATSPSTPAAGGFGRFAGTAPVPRNDCGKHCHGRNEADPAAIIAAARATHVSGFAEAMPGGYDRRSGRPIGVRRPARGSRWPAPAPRHTDPAARCSDRRDRRRNRGYDPARSGTLAGHRTM